LKQYIYIYYYNETIVVVVVVVVVVVAHTKSALALPLYDNYCTVSKQKQKTTEVVPRNYDPNIHFSIASTSLSIR